MKVVVTGANGFLGRALVARLARADAAGLASSGDLDLVAFDLSIDAGALPPGVLAEAGDVTDPATVARVIDDSVDLVFHLAAVVSGTAEQDFDAGLAVNVDGSRLVIEACRRARMAGRSGRLVHASSIAVFGAPLPARIDDRTEAAPSLSYGFQKRIVELLIDDCSRRGLVDGRSLRFPGVVVRPPAPNGATSAFNSALFREPLEGRDLVCPASPEGVLWITSIAVAVEHLIHAARLPADAWERSRVLLLPAVAASCSEIVAAVERASGQELSGYVRHAPEAAIEAAFARWPREAGFARATALGFTGDRDLDAIAHAFVAGRAGASARRD